jgi:CspA family cold shock protein
MMPQGTIQKKVEDRGFGFIKPDVGNGKAIFFHTSDVEVVQWDDVEVGAKVMYEEKETEKGIRAVNVRFL